MNELDRPTDVFDFRIRTALGISQAAYTTEEEAVEAAEQIGLSAFDVVQIKLVATYEVMPTSSAPAL